MARWKRGGARGGGDALAARTPKQGAETRNHTMSTILKALRKARTEPLRETVQARGEILSSHAHDYLATLPETGHDQVRTLRTLVYAAGAIIVLLLLVVFALLLRRPDGQAASSSAPVVAPGGAAPKPSVLNVASTPAALIPVGATATTLTSPAAAPASLAAAAASPLAAGQPIELTPLTPLATPAETPLTPRPAAVAQTPAPDSEEALIVRAAELRAQAARSGPPRRRARSDEDSGSIQDVRITGIVWDRTSPVAMIDGRVVRPGSLVRGARIAKINKDSVVFDVDGRQVTVRQ